MSNYLSLAAVTATLGRVVGSALEGVPNPSGIPRVRYGPPREDPQHTGCTIFLFRIAPDATRRNDDLPTRNGNGGYYRRPCLYVNAEYLLTFDGDYATLEAQRFLGAVAGALHAYPCLDPDDIKRTIAATSYLKGCDLGASTTPIRLTPATLDAHLISQLWSTFPQVQYTVSMLYTAFTVPIEAAVATMDIPPVEQVDTRVRPQQ